MAPKSRGMLAILLNDSGLKQVNLIDLFSGRSERP